MNPSFANLNPRCGWHFQDKLLFDRRFEWQGQIFIYFIFWPPRFCVKLDFAHYKYNWNSSKFWKSDHRWPSYGQICIPWWPKNKLNKNLTQPFKPPVKKKLILKILSSVVKQIPKASRIQPGKGLTDVFKSVKTENNNMPGRNSWDFQEKQKSWKNSA